MWLWGRVSTEGPDVTSPLLLGIKCILMFNQKSLFPADCMFSGLPGRPLLRIQIPLLETSGAI